MNNLVAIDFFCGGGGMTYGLSRAGMRVLGGIDYDSKCRDTYIENNSMSKFICADITSLYPQDLKKYFKIRRRQRNLVLVGCTPCQYWTILNTSKRKSEKSKNLLNDFSRFVSYYLPGYIVLENVPGIVTKKNSPLETFLTNIEELGYNYDYKVINTKDYGIPQSRKRFILVASRLKTVKVPNGKSESAKTVRDTIGELNGFKTIKAGHIDNSDFLHTCANLSSINLKRLNKTPSNGGNRLSWKDDNELQINAYKDKDHYFVDVYGRLFWDRPAPTITTKFLSISNGRFAHPEENRGLSIREGASLQTFPQSYRFVTQSASDAARIIGNAVPPKLAEYLGDYLLSLQ